MRRRSRSRSRSYGDEDSEGTRLHIADLSPDCSKRELEKEFEKFGKLLEIWLAKTPPCFGFAVFKNRIDAYDAMDALNGKIIGSSRIRVSLALPRARERSRRPIYDSNLRCYQCGEKGHFARDCDRSGRSRICYSPEERKWARRDHRHRRDKSDSRSRSRSRSNNKERKDNSKRTWKLRSQQLPQEHGEKKECSDSDIEAQRTRDRYNDNRNDRDSINNDNISNNYRGAVLSDEMVADEDHS